MHTEGLHWVNITSCLCCTAAFAPCFVCFGQGEHSINKKRISSNKVLRLESLPTKYRKSEKVRAKYEYRAFYPQFFSQHCWHARAPFPFSPYLQHAKPQRCQKHVMRVVNFQGSSRGINWALERGEGEREGATQSTSEIWFSKREVAI